MNSTHTMEIQSGHEDWSLYEESVISPDSRRGASETCRESTRTDYPEMTAGTSRTGPRSRLRSTEKTGFTLYLRSDDYDEVERKRHRERKVSFFIKGFHVDYGKIPNLGNSAYTERSRDTGPRPVDEVEEDTKGFTPT